MVHDSLQEASRKHPIVSAWASGDTFPSQPQASAPAASRVGRATREPTCLPRRLSGGLSST
eukprot:5891412-Pyramimonas_sp.AAC.1